MIQKPVRQNQSTTEQLFYWERTWYTKLALTTLTYLFREIKPKLTKETKPIVMSHRCRNFTLFLAQIPLSRVQSRYLERHVKGRHEDISQCKIMNEKNWWWFALRSIYLLHKEAAHYQVWKRGKSKWRILFDFFFMQLEWQMKKILKNSFETTFAILICLASILGNALLPYVVNRYSEMQTITNISFTVLHWLISSCHVVISWLISQHCRFSEWKTTSHHVLLSTNVWNAFC